MEYERDGDIVDFLAKPENIEILQNLAGLVPTVIDRLHIKFWEKLKEIVQQRLHPYQGWLADLWGESDTVPVQQADEFVRFQWPVLQLEPSFMEKDAAAYWAFWVEQDYPDRQKGKSSATLTIGVGFYSESQARMRRQARNLPPWAQELFEHPNSLTGDWKADGDSKREGWIVYKQGYNLRGRAETIRLAQGNSLENEVADALFQLFEHCHTDVEQENRRHGNPQLNVRRKLR